MQRHGDVEIERKVVAHADHEEHEDEVEVVLESDSGSLPAELVRENEPFQRDERKLGEGDEVAGARIMSAGSETSVRD